MLYAFYVQAYRWDPASDFVDDAMTFQYRRKLRVKRPKQVFQNEGVSRGTHGIE
jgi:hypothetical protein